MGRAWAGAWHGQVHGMGRCMAWACMGVHGQVVSARRVHGPLVHSAGIRAKHVPPEKGRAWLSTTQVEQTDAPPGCSGHLRGRGTGHVRSQAVRNCLHHPIAGTTIHKPRAVCSHPHHHPTALRRASMRTWRATPTAGTRWSQ